MLKTSNATCVLQLFELKWGPNGSREQTQTKYIYDLKHYFFAFPL